MSESYIEILGDPKDLKITDLNINIAVVERISEPFYEWYYEAVEGTGHEKYLQSRIGEMGSYLVALYTELEKRKTTSQERS
jgi:hypothetical protein